MAQVAAQGSLVVLGLGSVGRRLGRLVSSASHPGLGAPAGGGGHPASLSVAGVADSSTVVYSSSGSLPPDSLEALVQRKESSSPEGNLAELAEHHSLSVASTDSLPQLVQSHGDLCGCVVADCTASLASLDVLCESLRNGGAVALANKKHVGGSLEHYQSLVDAEAEGGGFGGRLRFESACGAGTPMVVSAQRLGLGNDRVHSIVGSLSGTLGVVCDALNNGTPLADAVEFAHWHGLTEPDPRDDLGGEDVHRKALVLARAVGVPLRPEDVTIEPLYPEKLEGGELCASEFISKLRNEHNDFQEQLAERAKKASGPLKYVANIDCVRRKGEVSLQEVTPQSPLGSLSGAANLVQFSTDMHGDTPLAVQGAGAGAGVTASGVLADAVEASRCVSAHFSSNSSINDDGNCSWNGSERHRVEERATSSSR